MRIKSNKTVAQTKTRFKEATKTAALPASFAIPDRCCCSAEILLTTASIPVLSNSTINTRKTEPTKMICIIVETDQIRAVGIKITATDNSMRKAISLWKVLRNPCML